MGDMISDGGAVERYLDRLFDLMAGTGSAGRRTLFEVEDHLREAVADAVAAGMTQDEAEAEAVRKFGPPEALVRGLMPANSLSVALRRLVSSAALLGAVGLVAIGVSGGVAAGLGAAFDSTYVAGDEPGVTYTATRCADFFEYYPDAASCEAAATAHHLDEVVSYRLGAGVLGVLALLTFLALRRVSPFKGLAWSPRADLVGIGGVGAFAVATVVLGIPGLIETIFGVAGAGELLSAGIVSLIGCAIFVPLLVRSLRTRPA
jgi:hypothetical protein